VELWVEKKNSSFLNVYSYLDTHLRVVHVVLIASERRVVLGPRFLNFGSYSRPKFGTKWDYGLKRKILHFLNVYSYLDTHLRVVHVVLIASEDV
jgi:hypothetical protein